ncbi:MBL fold metallo-hydrolase [Mucilaginibacter polytrichastri]|uniref:Metallo-beta-lactamase domain-containing protein n=1 Tax=Mucilaginibacter polytrichastri TaxID=1302689 RepID=A0A1Q5ZWY3_9SPHI|nr:MBL fold metallo-hydrolase [Mucilaginibacter polytrichastri]OKS86285.1 hypothetical protein RG47T_1737 [Mucilaginibacter polytrichastri]SFT16651.1 Glyoxylase, beta-lactamase superfamily II [Mucilaginibacter polytrichastri]
MKRITDNIYQIGLGHVNVFVIDDDGLTLIGTGPKGSTGKIFNAIQRDGLDPYDIKQIILTHAHPDHAGSAEELKRKLRVPVLAHYHDAQIMKYGIGLRNEMNLTAGLKNWLIYQLIIKNNGIDIEPVDVDEQLNDNDLLPILGGTRVIHTPGHTKGHISLWCERQGVLIAGDLLSNTLGLDLSVINENREEGIHSILKVARLDFSKVVFGHGQPILKYASSIIKQAINYYNYSLI